MKTKKTRKKKEKEKVKVSEDESLASVLEETKKDDAAAELEDRALILMRDMSLILILIEILLSSESSANF